MWAKEVGHRIRAAIGHHPTLFYRIYGQKSTNLPLVVRRDTELVIEGYPRSANTFAVLAFQHAQPRDVKLAHHLHVPAQVIRATQWRIPTLLLTRNPKDAVASLLVRYPYANARRCLDEYVRLHKRLYPLRDRYVVGTFEQVTRELGFTIERVNRHFGTNFSRFEHTMENTAEVFRAVDRVHKNLGEQSNQIARPTQEKKMLQQEVLSKIERIEDKTLLRDALAWYDRYRLLAQDA